MGDRIAIAVSWFIAGMCLMQVGVMVRAGESPWIAVGAFASNAAVGFWWLFRKGSV